MTTTAKTTAASGGLFRRGSFVRNGLSAFPLLALPTVFYLFMALFSGTRGAADLPAITGALEATVFSVRMISGVVWRLDAGDLLLLFGLLSLAIEIAKATSSKSVSIANHAASMGLLLICVILFLSMGAFATSTFFLLTMMTIFDVLVGAMVTIIAARRDFGVGDGLAG
ncbi:hypothetical protein [Henriciella litoralis]|uniref:hypothetical protein n=1 Tax=Henriciella litoralis TaxID=568102 RepID=UPI001F1D3EFA|nr:hypothetical protein [Henriciella litoralis]